MRTVIKTSVFPASRDIVFEKLQQIQTLQYIAAPYASFEPVSPDNLMVWKVGASSSYRFKLWGFIPFGVHMINIERFDIDMIQSREGNNFVPVWNHKICLKDVNGNTEYTDEVDIDAGWKTLFVWLWAKSFYSHRQRKWLKLLKL